ncbi:MAG: N-glycosylase/DNA lyase, partial [Candidatus Pacearchaeota archaeon]
MDLLKKINLLKRDKISKEISNRIKEFEKNKKDKRKVFSELCFCILTANYQAEKSIEIQKKMEKDFFYSKKGELAKKLKNFGHRFWSQRAERIVKARKKIYWILEIISSKEEKEAREEIAKNIDGLGMKESSHFLRNIGFKNLAIIDFHIVNLLTKEKIIQKPSTITKKRYLEIERKLEEIGKKVKLSLAELDLYLWYIETGKVL